jgi:phage major head subunit gpT-like protein
MAFNPTVIEKGLNARFAQAMAEFQAARSINPGLMGLALTAPSNGAYEKYGWLGAMPAVKQWIGERNSKQFASYDYTIKNLDWEASTPVFENDFDDDQTGSYAMIAAMLANRIGVHPEKLMIDLLTAGDVGLAYDGIAFFSNATGVRVNDNILTGTGVTLETMSADLTAAKIAMSKFVDDQGETLNIKADTIVCPVSLEDNFRRLVDSQTDPTATATGTFNPFSGKFTVIGDARLDADDVNDWYLCATREIVKPFIYQNRQSGRSTMEKTNHTKQWVFGADYRSNAGYGIPQLAIKTTNA